MAEKSLRFGVVDELGNRAASWKLFTRTGSNIDFYLACRELGGSLKTSFHQSGFWHTAYDQAAFERMKPSDQEGRDRFISKWPKPTEKLPGFRIGMHIITPFGSSTVQDKNLPAGFIKVAPAPTGRAIEFTVAVSEPQVLISGWPGSRTGTSLVGTLALADGSTVWVLSSVVDIPEIKVPHRSPHFFEGHDVSDFRSDALRALAFADCADGSKMIVDAKVAPLARP
ncbi:hypothetical protein [Mesorhizobium sp.]|uniref:hypothetical protein n=1 Tax=Mesorhizobium sp. TaxID=1871066 RepID=UPI0012057151|nr:hypothetical protein [Mesorhizobium sp.]TJV14895.1 MAG: hypothetical protein E5Y07_24535 [Mesorhizobium sp.]